MFRRSAAALLVALALLASSAAASADVVDHALDANVAQSEADEPSDAEVVPDDEGTDSVPFVVAGVVIVMLVVMLFVVRRRRPAP